MSKPSGFNSLGKSRASPETIVAGIVENIDGRVLMSRSQGGPWIFPCGPRRSDESYEAAMRRVGAEQLGVELDVHTGQPPVAGSYEGRSVLYRYFLARISNGEPTPRGTEELCWHAPTALKSLHLADLTWQVVRWYIEGAS